MKRSAEVGERGGEEALLEDQAAKRAYAARNSGGGGQGLPQSVLVLVEGRGVRGQARLHTHSDEPDRMMLVGGAQGHERQLGWAQQMQVVRLQSQGEDGWLSRYVIVAWYNRLLLMLLLLLLLLLLS